MGEALHTSVYYLSKEENTSTNNNILKVNFTEIYKKEYSCEKGCILPT